MGAHYITMLIGWGKEGSLSYSSFIKESRDGLELRPLYGFLPIRKL